MWDGDDGREGLCVEWGRVSKALCEEWKDVVPPIFHVTYARCFAGTVDVPEMPISATIRSKFTFASNDLMAATSSWMSSREKDFSDMLGYI